MHETEQQGSRDIRCRIRLREPDEMGPEERAEYESNPAARTNISRLFGVAETMAPRLRDMNIAMATTMTLPSVEREVVVLATLFLERGEYEIAQHREVAKMLGIPGWKVQAIENERYDHPDLSERERALLAFTRQVVNCVRVDDFAFNAVAGFYDDRQIMELVFVITNYMMLARITEVAQLPIDGVVGANFWKDKLPGSARS